jgi:hypothetical protein
MGKGATGAAKISTSRTGRLLLIVAGEAAELLESIGGSREEAEGKHVTTFVVEPITMFDCCNIFIVDCKVEFQLIGLVFSAFIPFLIVFVVISSLTSTVFCTKGC